MSKKNNRAAGIRAIAEALERRLLLTSITAIQSQNFDVGDLDGPINATSGAISGDVYVPTGTSITANQIREGSLTIDGTVAINPASAGAFDASHVSIVNSLNIAQSGGVFTGTLDIGNNVLIIRSPDLNTEQTAYNEIWAALQSGFNGGNWNGTGIMSSIAATDAATGSPYDGLSAIGIGTVDELGLTGNYAGQAISSYDIIVAFTQIGDSNLDGVVDINDFDDWAYGYQDNTVPQDWVDGNFEYGSSVTVNDFFDWLAAFQSGVDFPISTAPQATITPPAFVGSVTDTSASSVNDLTAQIDWGDGSDTSSGAIVDDGTSDNVYDVVGDHTYWQTGSYNTTATVLDTSNTTTTATATADVTGVTVTGLTPTATVGQNSTFNLATFVDNSPNASNFTTNDFTATVDWGDGSNPVAATVSGPVDGVYTVSANNTLTDPGTVDSTVTVFADDGSSGSDESEVDVSDPTLTATPELISPVAGEAFSGTVATFNYADTSATADQFQASLDWGDGNITDGTITSTGGGVFTVSGDNTYDSAGTDFPVVTVYDSFGNSAEADDTALVGTTSADTTDPGATFANEGMNYTLFFSPIAPSSGTLDHWSINWGDGPSGDPDTQAISGSATFAQHTFASGVASANIQYVAENASNTTLISGTWPVTIDPATPTDVAATWNTDGTLALSWSEASAIASSFTISDSENGGPFNSLTTVTGDSTTIDDLDPSAAYTFEVSAAASGDSTSTTSSTTASPFDGSNGGPSAPALTATAESSTEIDLSYTPPIDGSNVELEEEAPGQNFQVISPPSASAPNTYAVTSLQPDSHYYFRLRDELDGQLTYSYADQTTKSDDVQPLTGVTITTGSNPGEIDVTLQNSMIDDRALDNVQLVAEYDVGNGMYISGADPGTPTWTGSDGDYTGVALGPMYGATYRVRLAYDDITDDGETVYASDWTLITTPGSPSVVQPTGLTASEDDYGTLTFGWSYSGSTTGIYFAVEAFSYTPNRSELTSEFSATTTAMTLTENDWESDLPQAYVVQAFSTANPPPLGGGTSMPSNVALLASTTKPAVPQNVKTFVNDKNKITVVWDNSSNNEDGFTVQWKMATESTWNNTSVAKDASSTTITLPGTDPTQWVKPWDFQVIATNSAGNLGPSAMKVQSGVVLQSVGFTSYKVVNDNGTAYPSSQQWMDKGLTASSNGNVPGSQYTDGTIVGTANEHEYPISDVRSTPGANSFLSSSPTMAFSGAVGANWLVRGTSQGTSVTYVMQGTLAPGKAHGTIVAANLKSTNPLPQTIDFENLKIKWEISTDGGNTWFTVGMSNDPLFVDGSTTAKGSGADVAYETELYIGATSAKGATPHDPTPGTTQTVGTADQADKDVADKIYSAFAGHSTVRVDPTLAPLTYYGSWETPNQTAWSLLKNGHGQCNAWADLLAHIFMFEGVKISASVTGSGAMHVQLVPSNGGYIFVKNWSNVGGAQPVLNQFNLVNTSVGYPLQNGNQYTWKVANVVDATGVPGQNTSNPLSLFGGHQVVELQNSLGTTFYDPSYGGSTFSSLSAMSSADIQAYANVQYGATVIGQGKIMNWNIEWNLPGTRTQLRLDQNPIINI